MGFREHILDLLTRADIPVRHPVFLHLFFPFRLQSFTFPDALHNGEGHSRFQTFIDQIDHNIVTGTDTGGNGSGSRFDQVLGVPQPYICTMGKSCDTDQVGEGGGIGLN